MGIRLLLILVALYSQPAHAAKIIIINKDGTSYETTDNEPRALIHTIINN